MRVIFLQDVGGTGRRGEIKDISDGYALNYLVPNGLVEQATPEKIATHKSRQEKLVGERAQEAQALAGTIMSLEGAKITLAVRATPKGGLFKAIGAEEIVRAIREQEEKTVPVEVIRLGKPLKEVGEHKIALASGETKATLTLEITAV